MNVNKSSVLFRLYGIVFCMRINVEEVFSDCFNAAQKKKIGSKQTNEKVTMAPERSATLCNFFGFQILIVKPLFPFLSFISPFTIKGAILFSINALIG